MQACPVRSVGDGPLGFPLVLDGLYVEGYRIVGHVIGHAGARLPLDVLAGEGAPDGIPAAALLQPPVLRQVVGIHILGHQVGALGDGTPVDAGNDAVVLVCAQFAGIAGYLREVGFYVLLGNVLDQFNRPVATRVSGVGPLVERLAVVAQVQARKTAEVRLRRDVHIRLLARIVGAELDVHRRAASRWGRVLGLQILGRIGVAQGISAARLLGNPYLRESLRGLRCADGRSGGLAGQVHRRVSPAPEPEKTEVAHLVFIKVAPGKSGRIHIAGRCSHDVQRTGNEQGNSYEPARAEPGQNSMKSLHFNVVLWVFCGKDKHFIPYVHLSCHLFSG